MQCRHSNIGKQQLFHPDLIADCFPLRLKKEPAIEQTPSEKSRTCRCIEMCVTHMRKGWRNSAAVRDRSAVSVDQDRIAEENIDIGMRIKERNNGRESARKKL